jgi:hypothetical protein
MGVDPRRDDSEGNKQSTGAQIAIHDRHAIFLFWEREKQARSFVLRFGLNRFERLEPVVS